MHIWSEFIDWWLGETKYSPYWTEDTNQEIEREKYRRVARAQLEVSQEPTVESSHAVSTIPVHFIGQDARQRWTVIGCSAQLTSDTLVSPITSQVTCEPCILSQRYQAKVRVR